MEPALTCADSCTLEVPPFDRAHFKRASEVAQQEVAVEWVLIMSLQWVVGGSATAPTTHTMEQFQTEDLCKAAVQEIKNEMKATIQGAETRARRCVFDGSDFSNFGSS